MTEPTAPSTMGDPVAVILARMEVKLDNALDAIGKHGTTLDRHDRILGEHGNRLTAAETSAAGIPERIQKLEDRKVISPAAVYCALALIIAALGVVAAFLGTALK